jgi:stage V sporulation protein B
VIVVVAIPLAGIGKAGDGGVTWRTQLAFIAPLYAGQFTLNLLMQCDLHLLGRFAADAAVASGLNARSADALAGAYGVAQLFCFLPYQLLLSVTFVLFPLLASAKREKDEAAVARYVATGVRLALIIAGAFVCVNAGLGGRLLAVVFRAEDAALGGTAMLPLGIGLGSFAVFGILVTVLTSLGQERASALFTAVALALVVAACSVFVRGAAFGPGMIERTATATAAGLVLATLLAATAVKKTAGAVVSTATLVRVLGSVVAVVTVTRFLSRALPQGKLLTLALAAAVGVLYLMALVATRELGRSDLALVGGVFKRRRS